eukprot:TRINITY_DN3546_c0_g1_i1.p1 TRINITY_DN3546_c0_g1~~TRINITY_DN3546_c0_g1_i1.p1  ORF type:complete len:252 (+),score=66.43 TRINITY_DN3546_c0_g1_i1:239-994(+)
MNPNKFQACEFLMRFHEARGDKVIIFSDNIWALRYYATKLQRLFIYGPTSSNERLLVLQQFQTNPQVRTILISRVGDNSIDLPEANVIIQISSHFGSRRQEAQRLGRILRPKARAESEYNAFFYTLVSTDTSEMFFSNRRQQFLIDQGYAFKVVSNLAGMDDAELMLRSKNEQQELLTQVLSAQHEEETFDDKDDVTRVAARTKAGLAQRSARSASSLSGGDGLAYAEFRRTAKGPAQRHALFKQRYKPGK